MADSSTIQARSASEWISWLPADSLACASSLYTCAKFLNGIAPHTRVFFLGPMHAAKLVELAAIVASQNHVLRSRPCSTESWSAEQFWCISKARLHHWAERVKSLQDQLHEGVPNAVQRWRDAEPVLEEIFLAEVCTRVWCATLAVVDHTQLPGELDPIARSVFVGHLEARRRALRLLVFGRGLNSMSTEPLNRLRRDCESWTDLLLSNLVPAGIARQFAFDTHKINCILRAGQVPVTAKRTSERWSAGLVAMRFSLSTRTMEPAVSPELNAQLSRSILGSLTPHSFDDCGMLRPGWCLDSFATDLAATNVAVQLCGTGPLPRPGTLSHGSLDRM